MAGMMPLFVAAPRIKILVAGKPIAYAIGLGLNVTMNVERVKILGQFHPVAIDPLFLPPCSGSFRVIRLLSNTSRKNNASAAEANATSNVSASTQMRSAFADVSDPDNPVEADSGSVLGQGFLARHLDPLRILYSQTFDIDISIKVPKITSADIENDADYGANVLKTDATILNTDPNKESEIAFLEKFLRIRDCRLTGASSDLSPARLMEEPFGFEGLLAQTYNAGVEINQLDSTWGEKTVINRPAGG